MTLGLTLATGVSLWRVWHDFQNERTAMMTITHSPMWSFGCFFISFGSKGWCQNSVSQSVRERARARARGKERERERARARARARVWRTFGLTGGGGATQAWQHKQPLKKKETGN